MGKYEELRDNITTYCGLNCATCSFRKDFNCGGCIATNGHPFHGECRLAQCAIEKKRDFCGNCGEFPCELLKSYSNDETHGDHPKGARIQRCSEVKTAMVAAAREGIDPVSICGHHCDYCDLGQWCGGCRSVFPGCSYATLFEDGKCPNVTCAAEKVLDGCYDCPEMEKCRKGYYSTEDYYTAKGAALFIRKHGKAAFTAAHETLEKARKSYKENANSVEEILNNLEHA